MKVFLSLLILVLFLFLTPYHLPSKESYRENINIKAAAIKGEYKKVSLGMTREEALLIIEQDADLEIDTINDYGDFAEEQKYLLKAKRHPFIEHIYYQFTKLSSKTPSYKNQTSNSKLDSDKWILYAIIINFNPHYNDYPKLNKTISDKYGKADIMTSKYAFWSSYNRDKYKSYDGRDIGVKIMINTPASLKIIDESLYRKEELLRRKRSAQEDIRVYQENMSKRLLEDFIK